RPGHQNGPVCFSQHGHAVHSFHSTVSGHIRVVSVELRGTVLAIRRAALGHNTAAGSYLNPKDGWYTFGMDVNVFPVRWRSLQIHGSFGMDAEKLLEKVNSSIAADMFNTSWRTGPLFEISAGIGLFY
ncbi:MAG: hypothetical protein WCR31_06765, partial [Treponema sp.]